MSKDEMSRLIEFLEENGVVYGKPRDCGERVCWQGDGCFYNVEDIDGELLMCVFYPNASTAEQVIEMAFGGSDK